MTSPEASSRPPEKPADAPPSSAALSDKVRMKLLKQLQTQENKLQKLLAKSGEIESIESLRKAIEKETLFEPAIACLKKQAEIAGESKGMIDPKSFVEKAERLEALEKVFIKSLANGNASAVAAGELHQKFTDALSPTKPAEQAAVSPEANTSATPAAASSPEPVKTVDVSQKPAAGAKSLQELTDVRKAVLAEEKAKVQAKLDAISASEEQAGTETPPKSAAVPEAAKSAEKTPPPPANGPAAANAEKEKSAQKQSGNGNRVRPTILERVQQEAKDFEQGITIPVTRAPAKEELPKTAAEPPQKVEQAAAKEAASRVVKSGGSQDALARIIGDVEKSGGLKRKRGKGEVAVKGADMAKQIGRLARIFESKEFNEKSAEERERAIREAVELLTTDERLQRDLLSAFEQKGWLTKGGDAKPNIEKKEGEKKALPASSDETPPAPSRGGGERSDLSPDSRLRPASGGQVRSDLKEPTKKGTAEALLHQILTDVTRVPAGETIPRRMSDGHIIGVSGKDMAAEIQKVIKTYQTLEFPKKTLKERREIVLRDIDNTTSHPLLRADLERAFAAKGWLPQVVEPAAAIEAKATELKPPVETEPKKVEPAPSRGGGERSDLSPDSRLRPASGGQVRSDLKEPPSPPAPPSTPIEAAKSTSETPPKDAPATLAGNPPPKESTPTTPVSAPVSAAEKTPVAEPSAKTKPSLAELLRARARGGSAPATVGLKGPLIEKVTPPPAVAPTVEKAAPIPTATPMEKTATPQPAKTGPSLAELLRERMRGGAKKESAPIPPKPSVPSRTEAVPPKPPETVSASKSVEIPPAPSRGGGERSDLAPDLRSDLKELPPVAESAPRGSTPEQQKALTFENLATWPKEDLAKLAAAVPDDAVWAVALQGMTTNALEKAVLAALPPGRVDNFALEGLTIPIQPKDKIEKAQKEIEAKAREVLAAKAGRKPE